MIPEWMIRETLWASCRGCKFVGVQQGVREGEELVLFLSPNRSTTLSIPLQAFSDPLKATELVRAKLALNEKKWNGDAPAG